LPYFRYLTQEYIDNRTKVAKNESVVRFRVDMRVNGKLKYIIAAYNAVPRLPKRMLDRAYTKSS